jgi:preprotein translocase subunit YajC
MFFVTPAYAQAAGGAAANGTELLMQFAPFGIILLIMYLLILRPQQQRAKQHEKMVQGIRRGDMVITNGGLVGRVSKVTDDAEIEIEIAPNVRVRQLRSAVTEVRSKGEPVKSEPAKAEPAKADAGKNNQGRKGGKKEPAKVEPAKAEPAAEPAGEPTDSAPDAEAPKDKT